MLTVLMPSRGRERQATEAYEAFANTKRVADTQMIVVLDEGEPGYDDLPTVHLRHEGYMAGALNAAARQFAAKPLSDALVFIGDDHRFRTVGWDERMLEANNQMGGGIVYGNDLIRGEELPSAVFMDVRIVRALGWMALPGAKHLYLDDTWRELGAAMNRLKYLPDVVIEHMHPTVGKAEWDENYARVNDSALYDHDNAVYQVWLSSQRYMDAEIALVALA